ncbi:hypothetical protein D3C85_1437840 [compost metagenome]
MYGTGVGKLNVPFALRVRASAPLLCRTTDCPAASPLTLPLTVKRVVAQTTAIFVTAAVTPAPAPPATEQTCPAGCWAMVTA